MAVELRIDVYFDLICPWCLIGKRNLDCALLQFKEHTSDSNVDVRWHSVQLLPDAPVEGWDFDAFYRKRLGSQEAVRLRQSQVNSAAHRAGFQIDFGAISRMPHTAQAHQLLGFASTRLSAEDFANVLEDLFAAHFSQGANLGDEDTLMRIAEVHGLDRVALLAWIQAGAAMPHSLDVPGVPFFVFNRKFTRSGAVPPDALLDAMYQALAASEHACAVSEGLQ